MKGGENMIKRKGFTLIELLVVIGIIALLSTLAVVALNNARLKAREAKRVADIKQTQTALELYFQDQASPGYPVKGTAASPVTLGSATELCISSTNGIAATCAGTTYMGVVPANPTPNGTAYSYHSVTSAGADCTAAPCAGFEITFTLEAVTGGLSAGLKCASEAGIANAAACTH